MKKKIYFIGLLFVPLWGFSQDDLLASLAAEDKTTTPVVATFKGQRLVSAQTTEQLKKKNFNFNILHRFGNMNNGVQDFFGLDVGSIRFVLDYGITNKIQVSVGRSSVEKMYDVGLKAKILEQKTGYKKFPFSLSYYGVMGINTSTTNMYKYSGTGGMLFGRLSYTHQLLVAQKVNEKLSWVLAPTAVYYNVVDLGAQKNLSLYVGVGGSVRISRSTRFNVEYYPRIMDRGGVGFNGSRTFDHLGVGFDIETGGTFFNL